VEEIVIVGSGSSAVHFALSALRKGHKVHMLDVGYRKPRLANPEDGFLDLKSNLADPAKYFLGEKYEGVIYPDFSSEYYGFPPSKNYVFSDVPGIKHSSNGFSPLFSYARGGLAEAWTAGVYPLNGQELADFPFSFDDLEPYYNEVAKRIGVTGLRDDLIRFYPFHEYLSSPLNLDEHSRCLLMQYEKKSDRLNKKLGFFLGRSRVAVLGEDVDGRLKCDYSGRCLWGCPTGALYTPSITLDQCIEYPNFRYSSGIFVKYFKFDSRQQISSVVGVSLDSKMPYERPTKKLVLAAGALSSSRIFMESIYRATGQLIKLSGLMDNRQILIPFINLRMIGKPYDPETYQYHQIALSLEQRNPKENIHGQITTLKTASIHPIIQNAPFDLKTSIFLFRNIHSALGLASINFHDTRREDSFLSLSLAPNLTDPILRINYVPPHSEKTLIKRTIRRTKKALLRLGCIIPPGMTHVRPMGASVHYAGTIPMSKDTDATYSIDNNCQSRDFKDLYILDGASLPFLPAKQLTFTLMANAVRVAETAF
jgi:choline dehydrogenase-like flavoprotein